MGDLGVGCIGFSPLAQLSRCNRDERSDRPFRRGDRRADSDLADPDSRVHKQESRAIADSGEDQPARRGPVDIWHALNQGLRKRHHESGEHDPGQHGRSADQPCRARCADRGRSPGERGTESAKDRDHGGSA